MISFKFDENTEILRTEFLQWLEENPPPEIVGRIELDELVRVSTLWQKTLARDRWLGLHWPERYGGRGRSIIEEAVVQGCLVQTRAPQLVNLFGLTVVGPVLIAHGTEQQQERFLPSILTADEVWCQGFSEPQAGSDLASVKTVAVRKDSGWEISGQKIWTSFAQYAQWCFALARTEDISSGEEGLGCFLVPMGNEGVKVRPLHQITGDEEFNEVTFDKVSVSDGYLVGHPDKGWEIALSALRCREVILTFSRHLQSENALTDIRRMLRGAHPDSTLLERYGRLVARSMAVRALAMNHLLSYRNNSPGPEGAMDRLSWSETFQDICKFALEIQGRRGIVSAGKYSLQDGLCQHRYLYSRGRTIAGRTSEIHRNTIAREILGLPEEQH